MSYHAQGYMLRSLLTQSFNIVNTQIFLLFSKKWVPGFAAEVYTSIRAVQRSLFIQNHSHSIMADIIHDMYHLATMSLMANTFFIQHESCRLNATAFTNLFYHVNAFRGSSDILLILAVVFVISRSAQGDKLTRKCNKIENFPESLGKWKWPSVFCISSYLVM